MSIAQALPQKKQISFNGHMFTVSPLDFNDLVALEEAGIDTTKGIKFSGLLGVRTLVFLAARKTKEFQGITLEEAGLLIPVNGVSSELPEFLAEVGKIILASEDARNADETDDGAKKEPTEEAIPITVRPKRKRSNVSSAG